MPFKETPKSTGKLRILYESVVLCENKKHSFVQKEMKPVIDMFKRLYKEHSDDFDYMKNILQQIPFGMTQACIRFMPNDNERTVFIESPTARLEKECAVFVVNLTPRLYIADDAKDELLNFKRTAPGRRLLQLRITIYSNRLYVSIYKLSPSPLSGDLKASEIMNFSTLEETPTLSTEYSTDIIKTFFAATQHMLLSFATMFTDNFETFVENFIEQAHIHYVRPTAQLVGLNDASANNNNTNTTDDTTDTIVDCGDHNELLKKLNFDKLSYEEKDAIYRAVWLNHVKNDIKAFIKDEDVALTEDQIDHIARLYVYDGEYDCNLSYWDNLSNLINEEKRSISVLTKGGFLS